MKTQVVKISGKTYLVAKRLAKKKGCFITRIFDDAVKIYAEKEGNNVQNEVQEPRSAE